MQTSEPVGADLASTLSKEGSSGWSVRSDRPHPNVAFFEIQVSDYREFFLVITGDKSVHVARFDPSDETHLEPESATFVKPYQWELSDDDDSAVLQIWQTIGAQR